MKISKERLQQEAEKTGFRLEILEKVIHLLELLNAFIKDDFLSERIALKGGTALNLFYYDCPRLSVDIDINYIGSADREVMLKERSELISKIENICLDKEYVSKRKPDEHAGGKWVWGYKSNLSINPRLEVDLNFLTRVPLWAVTKKDSISVGAYKSLKFPILDKHDLAGGKLKALFSRHSSRDLFDTYYLLNDQEMDIKKLRIAFVIYGAMSRIDWRKIRIENINFHLAEFKNMLLPMLSRNGIDEAENSQQWFNSILTSCKEKLTKLLPLQKNEVEFLNALLDYGEIKEDLLTQEYELKEKIQKQPGLIWKALNVKQYRGV